MRVLLLILDAFDPVRLSPHLTPNLWSWANADGAATGTGEAVMAACTYPNHASFATGVPPSEHGIYVNHVIRDDQVVGAWEVGPSVPTLFDSYVAESLAVLGDHHLVGVMGARAAASHWPPNGDLPLDIELDPLGYPADSAVLARLVAGLAEAARLTIGYFGSIDTYSHLFGPESEEAREAYRRVDGRIAEIEAAISWDEIAVIVVSDHIQNTVEDRPGIDLRPVVGEGTILADEGSAILIGATLEPTELMSVDGVAGARSLDDGNTLAWCEPARFFGPFDSPILRGVHGNVATRTQLAMVTGGHPKRHLAADVVNAGPVPATAWAGVIRSMLDQ
ncbi:hypothetical protein BH18ACT6_BH18ACT6_10140 [soil metagenome]